MYVVAIWDIRYMGIDNDICCINSVLIENKECLEGFFILVRLLEGWIVLLHEVPHDPGARHQVIIKGELVSILARAEYEVGLVAVVTTEQS